ncbi:MAG TPA: outer membrane beta-barrel protein [Terriglobales bacterium]|nr:outer membrane beta-barrel protein [Terriglobales bacterium]
MKCSVSSKSRSSVLKFFLFLTIFTLASLFAESIQAVDISSSDVIGFRGGFWRVDKARTLADSIQAKTYTPYLELFISHGIKKGFSIELDLGAGYRGDTKFTSGGTYYFENWNLYPISGKVRYSLFSIYPQRKFQPYLDLGVTFLTASSTYSNPYYLDIVYVSTRTAFGVLAGWGADFSLSPRILFNVDFQYRWVSFGDYVAGIKNYSGPQLTFGLGYVIKQRPHKRSE